MRKLNTAKKTSRFRRHGRKPLGRQLPGISVVVIGLNVERFIQSCLEAIRRSNYPADRIEIIYVDSGSSDSSVAIAQAFGGIKVVELNTTSPNAAKGRNAGTAAASFNLIQFVDADSYLSRSWLRTAHSYINDNVVAVTGMLNERYPDRNWYHRMADLEWNLQKGDNGWSTGEMEAKTFGGNVLLNRSALVAAGCYNESLLAGEDPDLSYRIRNNGNIIYRINRPMASHDINLDSFRTFFKRTRRSGYAYAQLALRHWKLDQSYFRNIILRITGGALAPAALTVAGFATGYPLAGLAAATAVALRLLLKVNLFSRIFGISRSVALQYSLHLAFAVYPQFLGAAPVLISSTFKSVKNYLNNLVAGNRNELSQSMGLSVSGQMAAPTE